MMKNEKDKIDWRGHLKNRSISFVSAIPIALILIFLGGWGFGGTNGLVEIISGINPWELTDEVKNILNSLFLTASIILFLMGLIFPFAAAMPKSIKLVERREFMDVFKIVLGLDKSSNSAISARIISTGARATVVVSVAVSVAVTVFHKDDQKYLKDDEIQKLFTRVNTLEEEAKNKKNSKLTTMSTILEKYSADTHKLTASLCYDNGDCWKEVGVTTKPKTFEEFLTMTLKKLT